MLDYPELKALPVVDNNDLILRLVIDNIYSSKAVDEFLRADRGGVWVPMGSVGDYTSFWYSHLFGGGCYNAALTIHGPQPNYNVGCDVTITPASGLKILSKTFSLVDPSTKGLQAHIREILDAVKKYQGRQTSYSPWSVFHDRLR